MFKFICGLGNNNVCEIKNLVDIYANAGVHMFDSSIAMAKVVQDTIREVGLDVNEFKHCVSISIGKDIHGAKVHIDPQKCVKCGACTLVCSQDTVENCIGCMKCKDACRHGALGFSYSKTPWEELESAILNLKIDCVEMHASVESDALILNEFAKLCNMYKGGVSVCISDKYFKGDRLLELLIRLREIASKNEYFVVQADGNPMGGTNNNVETTMPCILLGKYLSENGFSVILSGGVNAQTPRLVKEMGFKYSALAYGSYARLVVKGLSKDEAVLVARRLVCET